MEGRWFKVTLNIFVNNIKSNQKMYRNYLFTKYFFLNLHNDEALLGNKK